MMRKFLWLLAAACLLPFNAHAHGPSPQKAVKEVTLKAPASKVWALVKDFGGINKWHPEVLEVKLDNRMDTEANKELPHRLVKLKNGTSFLEKLREVDEANMKLDYKMLDTADSTIPVSNYRTVMQVKQGANTNESVLTWTGRYYNKANSMEALPGLDNPTANKAINELYDAGLVGIKNTLEK